ncbi:MAG: transposase, partial [Acidobacteria bacterium]|nr:transposase [Acidobacteriota bacterium]
VFAQPRSHQRALEHALAWPSVLGERTIAGSITVLGRDQQDWSADYKIYSRSPWSPQALFEPVVDDYLKRYPKGPVVGVIDDTGLPRTGKKVPGASWQRDPLSPPFHLNLRWGQRFIQMGLLFPHYQQGDQDARSVPIRFEEAPVVRKPGKRASEQDKKLYREQKKQHTLSTRAVALLTQQRQQLDDKGAGKRPLLVSLDGGYCNRTVFRAPLDRTHCWPAAARTPGCAFPPRPASAASTGKKPLRLSRSARISITVGSAPAFAMRERSAGFATSGCRACCGSGGRASARCG